MNVCLRRRPICIIFFKDIQTKEQTIKWTTGAAVDAVEETDSGSDSESSDLDNDSNN
jgi:hypothetical protein